MTSFRARRLSPIPESDGGVNGFLAVFNYYPELMKIQETCWPICLTLSYVTGYGQVVNKFLPLSLSLTE